MKLLIIFSLLSSLLFATIVEIPSEIHLDSDLTKSFQKYWKNRGEREFDKTYDQELPYLQYIHSRKWYKDFFIDAPKFRKVLIKKVHSCTQNVCILGILLFKDTSSPIYLYDKWIRVNDKWYHRYSDSYLPIVR